MKLTQTTAQKEYQKEQRKIRKAWELLDSAIHIQDEKTGNTDCAHIRMLQNIGEYLNIIN